MEKELFFHYIDTLSFSSWGEWSCDASLTGKELFTFLVILIECVKLMDTFQDKTKIPVQETKNKMTFKITWYPYPDLIAAETRLNRYLQPYLQPCVYIASTALSKAFKIPV